MEIGKIPNDILKEIVLDKINFKRDEVLIRPKIGEDCGAINFGNHICVFSTDPITGTAKEIGRLAVHISCNDVASCGAEPVGIMITLLAPPHSTRQELEQIMSQIFQTAEELNVDIIGGHTEVTNAVNRYVINSVALGKAASDKLVRTSGALPGDQVILTKTAGVEGTAILAHEKAEELARRFGMELVRKAAAFMDSISVVPEGILAGQFGVTSMHDVTEGGVLGAAWEVSEASGTGIKLYRDQIPVAPETVKICGHFHIDPLKLISSGCMLITCSDGEGLVKKLQEKGISAAVIGVMTENGDKLMESENSSEPIPPPGSDELYKVLE